MKMSAVYIWVVQMLVAVLIYQDLSPGGARFVARSLGLHPGYPIWICLITLTFACLFLGSRIAANTFAAYTGKRPNEDWHSYGRSGAAQACYWCGLGSFAASLVVAQFAVPKLHLPGVDAGLVCALALAINCLLIRLVVRALLRWRLQWSL